MLTSSYPLYEGDMTAPFIEEIAAGVAARGHEVHVVLPDHPRLRRSGIVRGVHLHPFAVAPVRSWGAAWGYAGSLAGDVAVTKGAVAIAPLALTNATRAVRRVARQVRPDILHAHWVIPNGPPVAVVARRRQMPLVDQPARLGCLRRGAPAARAPRRAMGVPRCRRCDGLLRRSRHAARSASARAPDADDASCPYGVDAAQFKPVSDETRAAVRSWFGAAAGDAALALRGPTRL